MPYIWWLWDAAFTDWREKEHLYIPAPSHVPLKTTIYSSIKPHHNQHRMMKRGTWKWGSWDSSVVRACNSWSKGCKFESQQEWWDKTFLQCQPSVLLFWYPFHPRVTKVTCKRSQSFCQKCKWQVTAKHTCTLHMWLAWSDITWCMVVWCTQNTWKRWQFHMAPAI